MATALVAYSLVLGGFLGLALAVPYYGRIMETGEKEALVGWRMRGVISHLNVRDIALGDVVRERAEEKGYGPEIEEQMEKLMVELYLEKRRRDQDAEQYGTTPRREQQL